MRVHTSMAYRHINVGKMSYDVFLVCISVVPVQILELDLGSLTAGCMMPGEFEERLKAVLNEVSLSPTQHE